MIKVFISAGELWVSYAEGSGTATRMNHSYISNNLTHNYDLNAEKIANWSESANSIKKKGNRRLLELPVFKLGQSPYNDNPIKTKYMVVAIEKNVIINFFDSKKESLAWIR